MDAIKTRMQVYVYSLEIIQFCLEDIQPVVWAAPDSAFIYDFNTRGSIYAIYHTPHEPM